MNWFWSIPVYIIGVGLCFLAHNPGNDALDPSFIADSWRDAWATAVLWPLFIIKYILIALYELLMLFGDGLLLLFGL